MLKIIIIFLILPFSCLSQKDSQYNNEIKKNDTIPLYDLVVDPKLREDVNKSAFEIYVNSLADSINTATKIAMLPKFLQWNDFDNLNNFFWTQGNKSISLRNIIISRVNNCSSLKLIISTQSNIYKKKPTKNIGIKFSELSFYDLALKRYILLACNL